MSMLDDDNNTDLWMRYAPYLMFDARNK
ncbi:hypothetical protein WG8_5065 [Paenibacillus sp. Aloe-11]|nr:hypothetical protein WG8_5065 [Paenibacillus sp. Aloe-11]